MAKNTDKAQLGAAQQAADQSAFWWQVGRGNFTRGADLNRPLLTEGVPGYYREAAADLTAVNQDAAQREATMAAIQAAMFGKGAVAGGNTGQVFGAAGPAGEQARIGMAGAVGVEQGAIQGRLSAIARALGISSSAGEASLGNIQNQIGALRSQPPDRTAELLLGLANAGFSIAGAQPNAQLKTLPPSRSYTGTNSAPGFKWG